MPTPNPIMKFFEFKHLPEKLQGVSGDVYALACSMEAQLPDSAEKSAGLRKLLEAKDCFVRAALPIAILLIALTAQSAEAGPLRNLLSRLRPSGACVGGACASGGQSAVRGSQASRCYVDRNGVKVCPVK